MAIMITVSGCLSGQVTIHAILKFHFFVDVLLTTVKFYNSSLCYQDTIKTRISIRRPSEVQ
jgi:hypothetical protein